MPYVTVSLLQSANSILTTFSGSLQKRAIENFKATGVNVRLGVRVTNVTRDTIELTADGKQEVIDYGVCVWSTGAGVKVCAEGVGPAEGSLVVKCRQLQGLELHDTPCYIQGEQGVVLDCTYVGLSACIVKLPNGTFLSPQPGASFFGLCR